MYENDMVIQSRLKDMLFAQVKEYTQSDEFKALYAQNLSSRTTDFTITFDKVMKYLANIGIYKFDVNFNMDTTQPLVKQVVVYTNMKILEFLEQCSKHNVYFPKNGINELFDGNYCYILVNKRGYKFTKPVSFFLSDYIEYNINFEPYKNMLYYGQNYHFNDCIWTKYLDKGLHLLHSHGIIRISIPFPLSDLKSLNYFMKLTECDRLFGVRYNIYLYYDSVEALEVLQRRLENRGVNSQEITLVLNHNDYMDVNNFKKYFNVIVN